MLRHLDQKLAGIYRDNHITANYCDIINHYYMQTNLNSSREDLDGVYTFNYLQKSASPNEAASIDQLLSEIEQEFYGPDYKYTPQGPSLSQTDFGDSLSCPTDTTSSPRHLPAKNFLRSTRDGEVSVENYDILEAPGSKGVT